MKPTGWFQVAWSTDLKPGEVKPLRYFGQDLVAYRDHEGAVHVHDGICQHLGAHLGHGGCVTDKGIRCPFHGWEWGHNGKNVSIPYESRPNLARRVKPWPVTEVNESIYVWHDVEEREPTFPVLNAFELGGDAFEGVEFYPVHPVVERGVTVHPQVVAENAVDPQHFKFVHRTAIAPTVLEREVTDFTWRSTVGFGRRWKDHTGPVEDTKNTLRLWFNGIGCSVNIEQLGVGLRVITINTTPVDDERTDLFAGYWLDRQADEDEAGYRERLAATTSALPDDMRIWSNQQYLPSPGLAPSESAGFRQLRAWAQSFYPDTDPAVAVPTDSVPADA